MSQLKKSAIFNDIHFGRKNNSEEHNKNCLKFVEWFCEQVKKDKEIDHIVFQGDWFENRSAINISTLNFSYNAGKLLNDIGIPVFFIIGNHDLGSRYSRDIYSTVNFNEFSNFTVIDKPTVIDTIHDGVLFCPYLFKEEYESLKKYKSLPVWMGHFEFNGFVITGDSVKMEHGADHKVFKKQKKIFSGHFHKRQILDNVIYVGSPMCFDYSDADDFERGFATYDYENDNVEFFNWKDTPKYVVVNLSELKSNKIKLPDGAEVRVYVDIPISFEESLLITEEYKEKYNLPSFELRETNELKNIISDDNNILNEMDEKELALASVDDLVEFMIKSISTDQVDNDYLLSIYKELKDDNNSKNVVKATKPNKIKFKSVSMKNFMSYGGDEQTFTFDNNGMILIKGENLDKIDKDSNGCGKSSIVNSITYALYGTVSSSMKVDDLINNRNKKNMEVTLILDIDNDEYKIIRQRKCKNGNNCYLYKNGEVVDVPASLSSIDAMIVNIIGMEHYVFSRLVTFKAGQESFFNLPLNAKSGASQIKIIEELFNLSTLTIRAENLKEFIKDVKYKFDIVKTKIEQQEQELIRYNSQVERAETRMKDWIVEHNQSLKKLESQIAEWENTKNDNIKRIDNDIVQWERSKELKLAELIQQKDEFETNKTKQLFELNISKEEWELNKVNKIDSLNKDINTWENERNSKIEKLNSDLQSISVIELENEKKLHEENNQITTSINNNKQDIKLLEKDISSKTNQLTDFNKIKTKLSDEIEVFLTATCPTCLQEFKNNKHKLDETENKLLEVIKSIKVIEKEINAINKTISVLKNEEIELLNKFESNKALMQYSSLDEINKLINSIDIVKQKIETLKTTSNPNIQLLELEKVSINPFINKITTLSLSSNHVIQQEIDNLERHTVNPNIQKLENIKQSINPYIQQHELISKNENPHIDAYEELLNNKPEEINYLEINDLNKKLEHQNFLLKLLTKKDSFVRKALLNKNIPYLNQKMKGYLQDLGLPHSVSFTEEMQAQITQFGKELSFDNLSAGQQARVNIALSFAFRDVIQNMHTNINMCMLDEVLDVGLSDVGIRSAITMLKKKAKTDNISIFVISHRDGVESSFDKILTIQMINGFSKIVV